MRCLCNHVDDLIIGKIKFDELDCDMFIDIADHIPNCEHCKTLMLKDFVKNGVTGVYAKIIERFYGDAKNSLYTAKEKMDKMVINFYRTNFVDKSVN